MRGKGLLAAFLLGVGLCFVPVLGYGKVLAGSDQEISLFNSRGEPIAYIAIDEDYTIYLWGGKPVAYLYGSSDNIHIYTFNGDHLGWLEHGIMWDRNGEAVGFIKGAVKKTTQFEPLKGLKRLKPLKRLRELLPLKPIFTDYWSKIPLDVYLWLKEKQDIPNSSKYPRRIYTDVGSGHWVAKNIDGGRIIKLEDGSLWEISPIDRIQTMLWLITEDITVVETDNLHYPYKLINNDTGDKVEAKLISQ